MNSFLTVLVFLAVAFTPSAVTAQNPGLQGKCAAYINGQPNPVFFGTHPVHGSGLTPPGMIGVMNASTYVNPYPLEGTFVQVYNDYSWQVNSLVCDDYDDADAEGFISCYWRFIKSIPRILGLHHVVAEWRSYMHISQYLTRAQLGGQSTPVEACYTVKAMEPRIFEHLGVTALEMVSCEHGMNNELTTFYAPTPYGKLAALQELLVTNLVTGMAEYSLTDALSDPNGHITYNTIYRPLAMCNDPAAPAGTAFACESIEAYLSGETTLEEDPLAAAAGLSGLMVHTHKSASAKMNSAAQVTWPDNAYSRITYSMIMNGDVPETSNFSMRYVPGLHVTREQHAAKRF